MDLSAYNIEIMASTRDVLFYVNLTGAVLNLLMLYHPHRKPSQPAVVMDGLRQPEYCSTKYLDGSCTNEQGLLIEIAINLSSYDVQKHLSNAKQDPSGTYSANHAEETALHDAEVFDHIQEYRKKHPDKLAGRLSFDSLRRNSYSTPEYLQAMNLILDKVDAGQSVKAFVRFQLQSMTGQSPR